MINYPVTISRIHVATQDDLGKDIASLRQVRSTALARKTIFGERSYSLDKSKLDSIRAY